MTAKKEWTVWVGGGEINDHLLTQDEATNLAQSWKDKGYDDAKIQRVI